LISRNSFAFNQGVTSWLKALEQIKVRRWLEARLQKFPALVQLEASVKEMWILEICIEQRHVLYVVRLRRDAVKSEELHKLRGKN
jgi:hypothetical protein